MQLDNLGFNYDLSNREFGSMHYYFSVSPSVNPDKSSLGVEIKKTSESLQAMLDAEFEDCSIVKKQIGKLSAAFTDFGYEYSGTRKLKSWFKIVALERKFRASINCRIYAPEGKVYSVEIEMDHVDDHEDLLRFYDKILGLDRLELSSKAIYASNRIASLRRDPKFNEPLKLLK